jgi:hypothetical protein
VAQLRTQGADLAGPSASRVGVQMGLKNADILVFYGHGKATALLGDRRRAVVDLLMAMKRGLSGYVVIAFACSSAAVLGRLSAKFGVRAYLGYRGTIHIWEDADPVFRKIANTAPVAMLIDGRDARSAFELTRGAYEEAIDLMLSGYGERHVDNVAIARDLQRNKRLLTLVGDPYARCS